MKLSTLIGWFALSTTGTALIIAALIVALWMYDVREDRKHTVLVKSETPIFVGSGDESCGGTRLTAVQAGTTMRVQRIRYWKNCATLDVVLPDGRDGYIVLGDGEVRVNPPLQ